MLDIHCIAPSKGKIKMFSYWGNCINSSAEDIWALQDSANRVKWKTFKHHISGARRFLKDIGALLDGATDKDIEDCDWIAFNKGIFRGKICYFVDWSAIEWIFTKER